MNWSPIIRIFLRYLSGVLMARGFIDLSTANLVATDPDLLAAVTHGVEALIGFAIGAVSEVWYARARKRGGAT